MTKYGKGSVDNLLTQCPCSSVTHSPDVKDQRHATHEIRKQMESKPRITRQVVADFRRVNYHPMTYRCMQVTIDLSY
jgi:hypothetical protein